MKQDKLFHDSIRDALATDIANIGGVKVVAARLFPAMPVDSACAKLRAALNPEQRQELDPEEVMSIKKWARDVGSAATVQYEDQQLGKRSEWMAPEDEAATLLRSIQDQQRQISQQLQRLNLLNPKLAAVK